MGVWNKLRKSAIAKHNAAAAVDGAAAAAAAVEPATKKMKAAPEAAAAAAAPPAAAVATPEALDMPVDAAKVVETENEVAKSKDVVENKEQNAAAADEEQQKLVATNNDDNAAAAAAVVVPEGPACGEKDLSAISHVDNALSSFKEESNFIADLKESEKKALQEFKDKIEALIKSNGFALPPPPTSVEVAAAPKTTAAEETTSSPAAAEPAEKTPTNNNDAAPAVATESSTEAPAEPAAMESETKELEAPATVEAPVETTTAAPEVEAAAAVETTAAAEVEAPVETTTTQAPEVEEETAAADVAAVPELETTKEAVSESKVAADADEETTKDVAAEETTAGAVGAEETKQLSPSPSARPEEIFLWGVPLSESKGDERTDVILLKFLHARDFKVDEACAMLVNTIRWRKSFGADALLEEEEGLGSELEPFFYMLGSDREQQHPVCYNNWGAFQDKDLYHKTFGDAAKIQKFVQWRLQLVEKGLRQLTFVPGRPSSLLQVNDVKNIPLFKKEMRGAIIGFVTLLQDNYPELVVKNVFVNTPWYFSALYSVISPFITQRMKRKIVLARPGQIFKSIAPENVPVQYGGFARPNDMAFAGVLYSVEQLSIKAGEKESIEITLEQAGSTAVWDLSVIGWDISYGVEFAPTAMELYHSIIEKTRKIISVDEPIRTTFRCVEPGKLVLSIDNTASRKKKLVVYRFKVAAAAPAGAVTTAAAATEV